MGFFWDSISKRCFSACPVKFYGNSVSRTCNPCAANCDECLSESTCIKASSGYYLWKGEPVSLCPTDTFVQNATCVKCHDSCRTCNGPLPTDCISCLDKVLTILNTCEAECTIGTYKDGLKCSLCDQSCQSCNGPANTNCLSCKQNTFLDKSSKCVEVCAPNSYGFNRVCEFCDSSCQTCNSSGPNSCTSCAFPLVLDGSSCLSSCQLNYFVNSNRVCTKCNPLCRTCIDDVKCSSCVPPLKYSPTLFSCV